MTWTLPKRLSFCDVLSHCDRKLANKTLNLTRCCRAGVLVESVSSARQLCLPKTPSALVLQDIRRLRSRAIRCSIEGFQCCQRWSDGILEGCFLVLANMVCFEIEPGRRKPGVAAATRRHESVHQTPEAASARSCFLDLAHEDLACCLSQHSGLFCASSRHLESAARKHGIIRNQRPFP